jgi:hypothetical protein
MVIKNERSERRVVIEEMHVCGGRCMGEGGFEAHEVSGLNGGGKAVVGVDDLVVEEGGETDELEVEDRGWCGGEENFEVDGIIGEGGF